MPLVLMLMRATAVTSKYMTDTCTGAGEIVVVVAYCQLQDVNDLYLS